MKQDKTELVFILDRSGSMSGLESDTIGGFNGLLEKQRKEQGACIVTTALFDDQYELLHDRIAMEGIAPISEKDYYVRGSTALLDAIGRTIDKIAAVQRHTQENERAARTLFVIITDGLENASREYGYAQVKRMVEEQKERHGWEFLFLGANIDAIATAERFGIHADRAVNYHADNAGTALNYSAVDRAVSDLRAARPLAASWKADIEADYKRRR